PPEPEPPIIELDTEADSITQAKPAREERSVRRAPGAFDAPKPTPSNDLEAQNKRAAREFQAKNFHTARAVYQAILPKNPQFFPARIGVADCAWELGDHAAATSAYQRLSDAFPPSMIPARARQRGATLGVVAPPVAAP